MVENRNSQPFQYAQSKYIHENGIVYTDTKVKELEQKILDLENKLVGHLETQSEINKNLYEAIKDGGII